MLKKLKKRLKAHFQEALSVKTSPHSVALGFAIGSFIAILPTPGLSILIALLIALIYKKISKLSLFGAFVFWNPITLTPVYLLSYKIGNWLFQSEPIVRYNVVILDHVYNFTRRFLVGNLILAVLISVGGYFIVKRIVELCQEPPIRDGWHDA